MTDGSRLIANRAKHCHIEIFGNPTAIIARFVNIYFQSPALRLVRYTILDLRLALIDSVVIITHFPI